MKTTKFSLLLSLFTLALVCTECKKTKEQAKELITTVELHDHDGGAEYKWEDKEGDGNPTIDTVRLKVGEVVEFELHFYDASGSTTQELTAEIRAEAKDHLVIYASPSSSLQIVTQDVDANNKPLGLKSEWSPMGVGGAMVRISLKHLADKNAADPSVTGDTDVEVTFPVVITQ
jgi:hypothetical protein